MSTFRKNTSWIFLGNIIHAVLQFALNVYCANRFGALDYGILNYGISLIAILTAVGTFGFNGVITKFFAQDEENAGKYLGTTIIVRIIFSLFSILFLQFVILFDEAYDKRLSIIILCQSIQILFGVADLFVYWFRYKNQAKEVAILRLLAFFFSAAWRFIAIYYNSLECYTLGVSIEFGVFSLFLYKMYKGEYNEKRLVFEKQTLYQVLKESYPFIFSALMVTVYGQTDKIMLKEMLGFSSVGLYSVSLILAGAISIVPSALIEGFRPEIMKLKQNNEVIYQYRLKQLFGLVFWISVCYCFFITIFSKDILLLFYGEQYVNAANSLAVVVWYTSFSFFGAVNNLYMVAEKKTFWVQIVTFVGAMLNVILNFILIPYFGVLGAALASLITQIIANYLLLYLIKPLRPCFYFLNQGIILSWIYRK